jgi:hypothetical protein
MKKRIWIPTAIAVAICVVYASATWDAGLPPKPKQPTVEEAWADIAATKPYTYAVLSDHMDEARPVFAKFVAMDHFDGSEKVLSDMISTYGDPALARASDARAIDVLEKAGTVVDVISSYYPEGCRYFAARREPPGMSAISEYRESDRDFMEAKRLAYEDGKSRAPTDKLTPQAVFRVMTEDLGISMEEMNLMLKPDQLTGAQICSVLKRMLNVQAVPQELRGDWARVTIAPKG